MLDHLHPEQRRFALEDDALRIERVRQDRWIDAGPHRRALARLDDLLAYPGRACMPHLVVHGASGMGKTMIAEKFRRDHPPAPDPALGVTRTPVVLVQMPPGCAQRRFYLRLLRALGAPCLAGDSLCLLEDMALQVMRQVRPRLLAIDEFHNLLAGGGREQRRALTLIKFLGNELRLPIVAFGTDDALMAIRSDEQIRSRFQRCELPLWREDEAFRAFLATLGAVLPLRRPSALAERDSVRFVLARTGGSTRDVVKLVVASAEGAIRDGEERIDLARLKASADAIALPVG